MQIDVSGDSNVGVVAAVQTPVHAILLPPNANRVYVANGVSDNVSAFAPGTIFSFPSAVTTISFPSGSNPVFLHTTESATVYAADFGSSDVAVISASANVITQLIPVGPNPNLLAETPDERKLYVLNSGNNTITSINPVNKTVNGTFAVPGVSSPVWMDASLDSSQLFILDSATGVITSLNTQTDAVASTTSNAAGAGANFMLLDRHLNRLYVTNPSNNTVTIFDAGVANATSATPPALLKTIVLPAPASSAPMMVTALNDGTKAYVLSYQPTTSAEVTVIRTSDNSIVGQPIQLMNTAVVPAAAQTVCAAARFRASMTSSVDSSRVYVSLCDPGTTNIINTSTDSVVLPMNSPLSAYPAQTPPTPPTPPPQNPVWVVAGP